MRKAFTMVEMILALILLSITLLYLNVYLTNTEAENNNLNMEKKISDFENAIKSNFDLITSQTLIIPKYCSYCIWNSPLPVVKRNDNNRIVLAYPFFDDDTADKFKDTLKDNLKGFCELTNNSGVVLSTGRGGGKILYFLCSKDLVDYKTVIGDKEYLSTEATNATYKLIPIVNPMIVPKIVTKWRKYDLVNMKNKRVATKEFSLKDEFDRKRESDSRKLDTLAHTIENFYIEKVDDELNNANGLPARDVLRIPYHLPILSKESGGSKKIDNLCELQSNGECKDNLYWNKEPYVDHAIDFKYLINKVGSNGVGYSSFGYRFQVNPMLEGGSFDKPRKDYSSSTTSFTIAVYNPACGLDPHDTTYQVRYGDITYIHLDLNKINVDYCKRVIKLK